MEENIIEFEFYNLQKNLESNLILHDTMKFRVFGEYSQFFFAV